MSQPIRVKVAHAAVRIADDVRAGPPYMLDMLRFRIASRAKFERLETKRQGPCFHTENSGNVRAITRPPPARRWATSIARSPLCGQQIAACTFAGAIRSGEVLAT